MFFTLKWLSRFLHHNVDTSTFQVETVHSYPNFRSGSSCGGTIVGPRTIITAAHCLFYDNLSPVLNLAENPITVVVGPISRDSVGGTGVATVRGCGESINVIRAVPHPNYNGRPTLDNGKLNY